MSSSYFFTTIVNCSLKTIYIVSGCSSVVAWWICWPLELMKSQIQGGYMAEKYLIFRLMHDFKHNSINILFFFQEICLCFSEFNTQSEREAVF
jgi:hypothetical protein